MVCPKNHGISNLTVVRTQNPTIEIYPIARSIDSHGNVKLKAWLFPNHVDNTVPEIMDLAEIVAKK